MLVPILCTSAALAVEDADVLFFAPFEGSAQARISCGPGEANCTGAPRFAPGLRGESVVVDADSLLKYVFKDNVVPDEGTVMMWFKPEWPANDAKFHNLFRAATGNFGGKSLNTIMIYKYPRWARLSLYTSNGQRTSPQEGRSMAFRNELKWQPGEWVHVAGTWSASVESTEMYLYLNGERIAACGGAVCLPENPAETFEIGGPAGSGTTWFDDVLVFARPLLAREVKAIYDGYQGQIKAGHDDLPFVSSRELQLRPYVLFRAGKLVVVADYRGARRELGETPGKLRLEVEASGRTVSASREAPASGMARVKLDYRGLGPGEAKLRATLQDHTGKQLRTGQTTYQIPVRPRWVGNDLGKSSDVLPPWTPLRASGNAVQMWGREYVFGDSPLPRQIVSQERSLLRGPIVMRSGQSCLSARPTGTYLGSGTELKREWAGSLGSMQCSVTSRIEYDGFMVLDLDLRPSGKQRVQAIDLVIPLRPDAATLYHHCNGTWSELSDAGGIGPVGWSKALPFVPYVWLGTEAAGLAWFCESNSTWRNTDENRAVEILRTDAGVDLVVRFVDGETVLTEPLRLTFGFMATPVKPMPKGWRDWQPMFTSALRLKSFAASRWTDPGCRGISILWNNHVGAFSYLPAKPAEMRNKVATVRGNGWQNVVSYYALNQTQTGTPEYVVSEREWRRDPYGEQTFSLGSYSTVCTASTWADFLLWAIDKTMDETGTDGVYLDCCNPRFCKSVEHGCAPGRYPLFATRELCKRIYTLVRQKRGDAGFVYAHNSENNFITSFSFTDAVLNGEQYNRKDLRTLTSAKFRAELSPQPYGLPTFLLPTLVKFQKNRKEKMPGTEFLAFPLLHDVVCLPQWMSRDSQKLLRRISLIMHSFGIGDAEFLPYWSNHAEIATSPDDATVSAYLRRDGQAALLIAQGGADSQDYELRLGGRLTRLRGRPAHNPLTQASLSWSGDRLRWRGLRRDVQLVIVGASADQ